MERAPLQLKPPVPPKPKAVVVKKKPKPSAAKYTPLYTATGKRLNAPLPDPLNILDYYSQDGKRRQPPPPQDDKRNAEDGKTSDENS
jgi:hypothetical protein